MDVYQCPECELKFVTASELEQHLRFDHPEFRLEGRSIEDILEHAHRKRHRHPPPSSP